MAVQLASRFVPTRPSEPLCIVHFIELLPARRKGYVSCPECGYVKKVDERT